MREIRSGEKPHGVVVTRDDGRLMGQYWESRGELVTSCYAAGSIVDAGRSRRLAVLAFRHQRRLEAAGFVAIPVVRGA